MIKLKEKFLLKNNLDKIKNKNVLVRVDFNVGLEKNKISESYRILAVKETINFLKSANQVVLISHLGDEPQNSFQKLIPTFGKLLNIKLGFLKDLNSQPKEKFSLLENLRKWSGEKNCDPEFAQKLKNFGDVFVFEAFPVSHRKHASVYLLPKILQTFYGFNFEKEINLLNQVLKAKNPYLILGGAKISTKLPLIKKFLKKAELIILAGGLANTFLKAKNFEIGSSLAENEIIKEIKNISSTKIFAPFDFIVLNQNKIEHRFLGEIKKNDQILDIGPESLKIIFTELKKAKTIVFNGPLGYVEDRKFEKGTLALIKFLSKEKNKFILIGGGDSLAFLEKKKFLKKFKISTGGGAMLYYLAYEKLWSMK